jgi:hypothetical protein
MAMTGMVGSVTLERYEQLVADGRRLVELASRAQFTIGEHALEIEPMRPHGGAQAGPDQDLGGVDASLGRFADDIGLTLSTVRNYRHVAARWPAGRRVKGVSHKVHMILASIEDDAQRFATILDPPADPRTGQRRWTTDLANRAVGRQVSTPVTVAEKVHAVHELVRDESVAATVATDLLRRPAVAARAMEDDTARQYVNHAQVERIARSTPVVRPPAPVARAFERVEHTLGYVELVGACHAFVSATGRIVPTLRGRGFSEAERAVLHTNVAKVRGAADWVEAAVDTGNVSLDEGLAALLRGE